MSALLEAFSIGTLHLVPGAFDALFTIASTEDRGRVYTVYPPEYEVDGARRSDFRCVGREEARALPRGGQEIALLYETASEPRLRLRIVLRGYPDSPFLRLRLELRADTPVTLTKTAGQDALCYLTVLGFEAESDLTQIQVSHFDSVAHSYLPGFLTQKPEEQYEGQTFAGPIALLHEADRSLLVAYEHGTDHPCSYLHFAHHLPAGTSISVLALHATKGNYHAGQRVDAAHPHVSVWLELGIAPLGKDALLRRYREFFLNEVAENVESRKPYLYYNTWNHQERNKYFKGLPYLHDMHQERMLAEIDVAHRLGLDVFVIDTGWYGKTGDWQVNLDRFPNGLRDIKAKLDGYGMKLGLWFNPVVAAKTSQIYTEHPEYVMERDGKVSFWGPIWETEESYGMCLASGYADHFIETMVRLNKELGVVYFKWDAIDQYGCNAANHDHGTEANTPQERADCYAYESGRQMIRIVEEVSRRCPDVIVDFDITEDGRFVGLGFLSVGKYFLCNNGPYFHNFDIPHTVKMEPNTINALFYPGAARPRICRQGSRYDTFIPSILFLTHYLPDSPASAQRNTLAALLLGGNGIWGDLVSLSEADIALLSETLHDYKRVADSVTRAYPRRIGFIGSSPEIVEKIDPASGSGVVVFFTHRPGTVTHVTQPLDTARLKTIKGAEHWERLPDGRVKLTVTLGPAEAQPVFLFGD